MNDENTRPPADDAEVLEYPPITDSAEWTKDLILDHIFSAHVPEDRVQYGFYIGSNLVRAGGTRDTKADLVAWHDQQHNDPHATARWSGDRMRIPHVHTPLSVEATDEQMAMASKARNNEPVSDKPLSVQERKVLKELVDNDFNALKSEMKQFAADSLIATTREIEADWADKVAAAPTFAEEATNLFRDQKKAMQDLRDEYTRKINDLKAQQEDTFKALLERADRDGGVELKQTQSQHRDPETGQYDTIYQAEVKGLRDALSRAKAENNAALERGLMSLERQRLTAQRQVLVSGVSREAATILDSVPDAKSLMVESQRKQAEIAQGS